MPNKNVGTFRIILELENAKIMEFQDITNVYPGYTEKVRDILKIRETERQWNSMNNGTYVDFVFHISNWMVL